MHAKVNGTRLVVERTGSGPPILFVHGSTLDHRMWRPQVEVMSPRFECITYDVRGNGASAVPDGPFCHFEDAAALLESLGIGGTRKALVVGHSIGGLYSLELSIARPDLVAGLALVCMSGLGVPSFPPDLIAMFGQVRAAAAERGVDAAREIWRAGGWFAPARERSPHVRAELDAILDEYSGWYWLHQNPSTNLVPPALEQLGSLTMPVLVIDGERDLDYNHAVATELAARIRDVRLVRLPGVGHMAGMEDPALVTPELVTFANDRVFTSR